MNDLQVDIMECAIATQRLSLLDASLFDLIMPHKIRSDSSTREAQSLRGSPHEDIPSNCTV